MRNCPRKLFFPGMLNSAKASYCHAPFSIISIGLQNYSGNSLPFILKGITLQSWNNQDTFLNHFHTVSKLFIGILCQLENKCPEGIIIFCFKSTGCVLFFVKDSGGWCSEPQIPKDPWDFLLELSTAASRGPNNKTLIPNICPHLFSSKQDFELESYKLFLWEEM